MAGLKDIAVEAGIDDGLAQRFIETLATAIARGDRITLRGFGTFKLRLRKERVHETALMTEPVTKPAHYRVAFKPSDLLLDQLPTPDPDNSES